jgi:subtilisin family serine protease
MYTSLAVIALLVAAAAALAPLNHVERAFPGRYIVVFHKNASRVDAATTVKYFASQGIKMKNIYKTVIKGFTANLTRAQLEKVRNHPSVSYVDQDGEARIAQNPTCINQHNAPSWGIARICNEIPPNDDDFWHLATYGSGVNVYIIDTGIYIAHKDFGGRAKWGYTASDINPPGEYDGNGHGTHCASTAVGTTYGVAKAATVIAVKCLGDGGGGSWSGVIESIEWVAEEHAKNPSARSVGSMSLGGGKMQSCNDATIGATQAGVVMVAAAGNGNSDTCGFSPASASFNNGQVTAVIAVGATEQGPTQDQRSSFSNYGGQCTTVMAPGTSITGAWIGANDAERTISGTSMACPHVAGVAASVLSDSRFRGFNPMQVKDFIINEASWDKIDMRCPSSGTCSTTPNAMLHTGILCQ